MWTFPNKFQGIFNNFISFFRFYCTPCSLVLASSDWSSLWWKKIVSFLSCFHTINHKVTDEYCCILRDIQLPCINISSTRNVLFCNSTFIRSLIDTFQKKNFVSFLPATWLGWSIQTFAFLSYRRRPTCTYYLVQTSFLTLLFPCSRT